MDGKRFCGSGCFFFFCGKDSPDYAHCKIPPEVDTSMTHIHVF